MLVSVLRPPPLEVSLLVDGGGSSPTVSRLSSSATSTQFGSDHAMKWHQQHKCEWNYFNISLQTNTYCASTRTYNFINKIIYYIVLHSIVQVSPSVQKLAKQSIQKIKTAPINKLEKSSSTETVIGFVVPWWICFHLGTGIFSCTRYLLWGRRRYWLWCNVCRSWRYEWTEHQISKLH